MPGLSLPKVSFDEKPLTKKEADELLPKMKDIVRHVTKYMDQGISVTNRDKAVAKIWTTLDPEEVEIIATHLVEMGQHSRIVATLVRRVSNTWRLFQLGLIAGPRVIGTWNFYTQHGGFSLFGGGRENARGQAPAQNREQNLSVRPV